MINLVRNELTKIFSKKAIYIYTILVLLLMIGLSVLNKNFVADNGYDSSYIKMLQDGLKVYNLEDEQELKMFVGDKVVLDIYELSKSYDDKSPEKYYIDNYIEPLLREKYNYEYFLKDMESVKLVQSQIDERIKELDNYDWEKFIREDKTLIENEIKEVEQLLLVDSNDKELIRQLESLKVKLWCLNYRLDNEIPYSYENKSSLVDEYESSYLRYQESVKDESLLKNHTDLLEKKEVEEQYYVSLYKLENKIFDEDAELIDYFVYGFNYVDGLIICAIIIIVGSLISEEFNKGTIKQLLTKPYTRGKILTSKIIAGLIAVFVFIVIYDLCYILVNCYEYDNFTTIFGNNVVYDFNIGKVREVSILSQCLYGFVSVLPAYLIIFFLVILVGILSTSSVAAMISGFGLYLGGDLISLALSPKQLALMPFFTWDLSSYMYGGLALNEYATFTSSLIVNIVTILLLVILSYVFFKRKEVKNQ